MRKHIKIHKKSMAKMSCSFCMAEDMGFEPMLPFSRQTPLAGERFRPLSQSSKFQVQDR